MRSAQPLDGIFLRATQPRLVRKSAKPKSRPLFVYGPLAWIEAAAWLAAAVLLALAFYGSIAWAVMSVIGLALGALS